MNGFDRVRSSRHVREPAGCWSTTERDGALRPVGLIGGDEMLHRSWLPGTVRPTDTALPYEAMLASVDAWGMDDGFRLPEL